MAYPFPPSIDEFVAHAKGKGCEEVILNDKLESHRGRHPIHVLKHPTDPKIFIVLPNQPSSTILDMEVLASYCRTLEISGFEYCRPVLLQPGMHRPTGEELN